MISQTQALKKNKNQKPADISYHSVYLLLLDWRKCYLFKLPGFPEVYPDSLLNCNIPKG